MSLFYTKSIDFHHDPILLCLKIDVKLLAQSDRVYIPRLS